MAAVIVLPSRQMSLSAPGTTELFEAFYPWMPTANCENLLRLVLVVMARTSTFQCRLGLQLAITDLEVASTPIGVSASTNVAAVSKTLLSFDPNGAADGDIDSAMWWRIGVLYSSSSPGISRGDVQLVTPCIR